MYPSILEIIFFVMTFIGVSLWEYITFQKNNTNYPYKEGFAIFSLIQWIAIAIGMCSIFGFLYGIVILMFCMFLLQYISHFTIGTFWNLISKVNYLLPTLLFAINVWILLVLGVLQVFY